MGRTPCHSKLEIKKGPWTSHEDKILRDYVSIHGEGNWKDTAQKTGLKRCEKSCRFRWLNYLRPDLKLGNNISEEEEDLIIRLHRLLGNRWKLIAGRLPGRSGNEIKNYWNTTLSKKLLTDQENKYNQDAKLEKKSEQQPQLTATSTTGADQGPNFETKSNITIVDPYEQQNGDQMQHHNNQTSFWEYDPCENDDLMSFWVNSEIGDHDALDGNIQYKEHDSETMAGVLADYGCSSDNFSKEP